MQRQRQLHWVHYTDGTERGDQEVPGLFQARREFGAEMNTPFLGPVFSRGNDHLPRQARDKHKESYWTNEPVAFLQGPNADVNWTSYVKADHTKTQAYKVGS